MATASYPDIPNRGKFQLRAFAVVATVAVTALVAYPFRLMWKDTHDRNLRHDLFAAIDQQNVLAVAELLKEGANPNFKRPQQNRDYQLFTHKLDYQYAETALTACLYKRDETNSSAMGYTYNLRLNKHPNLEIVRMLLDSGASVNTGYDNGNNALDLAISDNNVAVVEMLLKHGALLEPTANNSTPAIVQAGANGNLSMIQFLIEHGANPNTVTNNGQTAIYTLIFSNGPDVAASIKYLAAHGADINKKGPNQLTPLGATVKYSKFATRVRNRNIVVAGKVLAQLGAK